MGMLEVVGLRLVTVGVEVGLNGLYFKEQDGGQKQDGGRKQDGGQLDLLMFYCYIF